MEGTKIILYDPCNSMKISYAWLSWEWKNYSVIFYDG